MSWTSIAFGALLLALTDAVLSHQQAAGHLGGFLKSVGDAVNRFLSPEVAAFSTAAPSTPAPISPNYGGGPAPTPQAHPTAVPSTEGERHSPTAFQGR